MAKHTRRFTQTAPPDKVGLRFQLAQVARAVCDESGISLHDYIYDAQYFRPSEKCRTHDKFMFKIGKWLGNYIEQKVGVAASDPESEINGQNCRDIMAKLLSKNTSITGDVDQLLANMDDQVETTLARWCKDSKPFRSYRDLAVERWKTERTARAR